MTNLVDENEVMAEPTLEMLQALRSIARWIIVFGLASLVGVLINAWETYAVISKSIEWLDWHQPAWFLWGLHSAMLQLELLAGMGFAFVVASRMREAYRTRSYRSLARAIWFVEQLVLWVAFTGLVSTALRILR